MEAPTLLIVGAEDAKFRCLAAEMSSAMSKARVAIVAGTGHAAHFEQPDAFQQVVLDFLKSIDW